MSLQNSKVARQLEKGKAKEIEKTLETVCDISQRFPPRWLLGRFLGLLVLRLHCVLSMAQRPPRPLCHLEHTLSGLSNFQIALLDWLWVDRQTDNPLLILSQVPFTSLSSFLEEEETKALQCARSASEERECESKGAARQFLGSRLVDKGAGREDSKENSGPDDLSNVAELDRGVERDLFLNSRKEKRAAYRPPCDNCGKETVKAKNCSGCKLAIYCSRECQKSHWKTVAEFAQSAKMKTLGPSPVAVPHKLSCSLLQQRVLPLLLSTAFALDSKPLN
uniref:MYND-type domain-containing protein n=1 Tax=Chromera velia CCMP2878 TaxID=1169474 RepID=A0A0G4HIA8_9ALVE|eukprot:Cvel_6939.t1-p1 / transcript=Cvel_6939.t1 / gene=Cvel_6939 / organism=Chromera_velia_CCMP2878 / gene_product=hypothetical protein / transcript_product=hypothetical protein / location=Cvel_scaffold351:43564-44394(+) / protein_length=277 / sequence_SO=supercontig / SO=protein_coding / is_pseudo=false